MEDKPRLRNWGITAGYRLIPAISTACLILVAVIWFSIRVFNHSPNSQTALKRSGEEQLIPEDLDLIKNLDLLEEMDVLNKLVQRVDDGKYI
jgi:hypothetical protein